MQKLRSPIKVHGGKYYLSPWIISHFPNKIEYYIEPFTGGANVALNMPNKTSCNTILADSDWRKINLFLVIRNNLNRLLKRLSVIEYNESTFAAARDRINKIKFNGTFWDIDLAVDYLVMNRMSRGGLHKAFAWSNRLRGGQPGDLNAWKTNIELLPTVSDYIQGYWFICADFISIFKLSALKSGDDTLIYLDPPYLPQVRVAKKAYDEYEMNIQQHSIMLDIIANCNAKIIISGYDNQLYNKKLCGWSKSVKDMPNHSSQSAVKQRRTEVLWMNYTN